MNQVAVLQGGELIEVLRNSLYPGAATESIQMVIGYCQAAGLDPMQKPVHIVPIWDSKAGQMRDVVMPGIGLYRIQASRSGTCAGISEPEFGEDVAINLGGYDITVPKWCRVTVSRRLPTGEVVAFTAKELWIENYAMKGGKDKSIAPNAMWAKRPYAQLAKCAEAQALRKAFPEVGAAATAEEMEGKDDFIDGSVVPEQPKRPIAPPEYSDAEFAEKLPGWRASIASGKDADKLLAFVSGRSGKKFTDAQIAQIKGEVANG
jgi:phage recombination protein Bet